MSSESETKIGARKCILQAAAKLFARLGLDKCSTREIAKESDSNISLISYYFGGKEGLYKEVMRDHANRIKANAQLIFQKTDGRPKTKDVFIEQVGYMIESMIWFRVNYPEMAKIFAREKLTGMTHAKEVHEEIFYPMILKFIETFTEGQAKGYVKSDINPALFFIAMSEGIWGFFEMMDCRMRLSQDCEELAKDRNEVKNQMMKIYLTGVLT